MQRDILFAEQVESECEQEGYFSLVNHGESSVEEMTDVVSKHFGLEV